MFKKKKLFEKHEIKSYIIDPGAEPGFFSGGGAPLRNVVTGYRILVIRKPHVIFGGGGGI